MDDRFEILVRLNMPATGDAQLLDAVSDWLFERGYVKESFKEAVKERERHHPTGLETTSYGVSIPHTDAIHVNKNAIFAVTLERPVAFHEMGGLPEDTIDVEVLFVLLIASNEKQLKLLMGFMKVIQNENDLRAIREAKDEHRVREILERYLDEILSEEEN